MKISSHSHRYLVFLSEDTYLTSVTEVTIEAGYVAHKAQAAWDFDAELSELKVQYFLMEQYKADY